MKKLIVLLFAATFTFATSAFAGGLVGVKFGTGELNGDAAGYTAGSNTYTAVSGSKDNQFGAIFAEVELPVGPLSVGVEYVPFDADIALTKKSSSTSANVSDFTTVYALASTSAGNVNVFGKIGYSMADIGTVKSKSTLVSQSKDLEGFTIGAGIQSEPMANGLVVRAEYAHTDFDSISVTTTSNGSASVKKTADGDLQTLTISIAKSF